MREGKVAAFVDGGQGDEHIELAPAVFVDFEGGTFECWKGGRVLACCCARVREIGGGGFTLCHSVFKRLVQLVDAFLEDICG